PNGGLAEQGSAGPGPIPGAVRLGLAARDFWPEVDGPRGRRVADSVVNPHVPGGWLRRGHEGFTSDHRVGRPRARWLLDRAHWSKSTVAQSSRYRRGAASTRSGAAADDRAVPHADAGHDGDRDGFGQRRGPRLSDH